MLESVLLAGGGTAGHVNPLLALADELRSRGVAGIRALGTAEGLEADLVPARGYPLAIVPRTPLPRRPSAQWLRLPRRLRQAVGLAEQAIRETAAQVVVGFGGYVAVPAYLAARRVGVPIVVHEQNARPGLANRLGARWATSVAVTFAGTPLPRAQVTGLPLRPQILDLVRDLGSDPDGVRRRAALELGLDPERTTLLVTGGSLGAHRLNTAAADCAADLTGVAQVLHLSGAGKDAAVEAAVAGVSGYHVRAYLDRMDLALAVADLVLARAGAGTVSELAALGLPAVYVPLPIGNGEQRRNATPVVRAGGGLMVADSRLDAAWIRSELLPLLADDARRAEMAAAARSVGVRDGAARLADLVEAAA